MWRHCRHCRFSDLWLIWSNRDFHSRRMVCNTDMSISNKPLYINLINKLKTKLKNLTLSRWVKVLFLPKMLIFCRKNDNISKIKKVLKLRGLFSETKYVCVLRYQTYANWTDWTDISLLGVASEPFKFIISFLPRFSVTFKKNRFHQSKIFSFV